MTISSPTSRFTPLIILGLLAFLSGCGAVKAIGGGLTKLLANPDVSDKTKQQAIDHQEALVVINQMGSIVWIGGLLAAGSAIMGGIMIYRGRPGGLIVIAVIGGSGLAMALFAHLFARYGLFILIGCSVPLSVYMASVVWRNGWFRRETSCKVEDSLIAEGDLAAAGAIHRARTGNVKRAREIAKNGHGHG